MLKYLFRFLFLFFVVGFVITSNSNAQDKLCGLQISIFEYDGNRQKISFKDTNLLLTNSKTKEKKDLSALSSNSTFENLSSGKYRIDINTNGYKRRVKDFELDCDFVDKNNVFSEHVNLWKDNSKNAGRNDSPENMKQTVYGTKDQTPEAKTKSSQNDKEIEMNSSKNSYKVSVNLTIDEDGNVISAKAIGDNSPYAVSAVKAARQAKFAPTMLAGSPIRVSGNIIYNFIK